MRRLLLLAALCSLSIPSAASAQARFLIGGGLSAPNGTLSDTADPGYHADVGIMIAIPTLPISIRADGSLHRMGAAAPTLDRTQVLGGSASLVYTLPGIGMTPYLLLGVGSYRTEAGPLDATTTSTDRGYHGGFGVNIGTGAMTFFSELRFVQINAAGGKMRLVPLTVGLRF